MNSEWTQRKLAEIAVIRGGQQLAADGFRPDGHHLVYGSNSVMGRTDRKNTNGPFVAFARVGSNCGAVMYSADDGWVNNNASRITGRGEINERWLYYALSSSNLAHLRSGSGQPFISASALGQFILDIPTLDEQRAIAEVLGSIDDRIAWSKRVLQALETLLSTTFGLLDRQQEATTLGSVMELTSGRSYKSIDLVDQSTVGLINLKNIPRGGGYRSEGVKGYSGAYKPSQVANPGDLVLACTDLTQAGDVIGRVGRVRSHRDFETLVPSMDLALVRPSVDWVSSHVLAAVMSESEYISHVKRYVNGTTVLHLDKRGVLDYEVRLPTVAALRDFAQFAGDVWERQDLLVSEADSLIGLRDALLPKLVSGELRIDNPERLLDQVA